LFLAHLSVALEAQARETPQKGDQPHPANITPCPHTAVTGTHEAVDRINQSLSPEISEESPLVQSSLLGKYTWKNYPRSKKLEGDPRACPNHALDHTKDPRVTAWFTRQRFSQNR
jgi:hypothetical protein